MSRSLSMSRRQILKASAAMASCAFVSEAFGQVATDKDKLRIAVIGCGGRGASNLQSVGGEHIAVLCDVDARALDKAASKFPNARRERDFRKVFDHADEFDAVVVSTSEHTHALVTLSALKARKHVYCEKPLTHNVYEARQVREAARTAGVATQMGTQIHATDNYRRVVELIQSGAIGNVTECHVWVSRAWGWQSSKEESDKNGDIVFVQNRPKEEDPVPEWLDWNLWLGPAPYRPFNNVYLPGPRWYRWWDFGNGTMSDLGSHWIDLPFWALDLDAPVRIEASGPEPHPEIAPASMQVRYEYAAKGKRQPLSLTWYQGSNKPELFTAREIPQWNSGVLFVGDQGMLLSDYGKHVLLPEEKFKTFERPPQSIPKSLGHHQEWIHACKTGSPTTCNFEYAGQLTEANHLGNVAYRVGKKIEWDTNKLVATNAPEAMKFLRRENRTGW